MTRKTLQNELYNYTSHLAELKSIDLEIDKVKREYKGISGMGFEDQGGGGTNAITRSVENEVIQKEMRIKRLTDDRERVLYLIQRIENMMNPLTDGEQSIIRERYFNKLDWISVSEAVGYSVVWCKVQNRNILDKLLILYK